VLRAAAAYEAAAPWKDHWPSLLAQRVILMNFDDQNR
jgi:hypothetical protein